MPICFTDSVLSGPNDIHMPICFYRFNNKADLMMSICLYVAAISLFIKPMTNMTILAVAFFMEGMGWMCINSSKMFL